MLLFQSPTHKLLPIEAIQCSFPRTVTNLWAINHIQILCTNVKDFFGCLFCLSAQEHLFNHYGVKREIQITRETRKNPEWVNNGKLARVGSSTSPSHYSDHCHVLWLSLSSSVLSF